MKEGTSILSLRTETGLPLVFLWSVGGLGEQPFMWQCDRLQLRLLAGAQVITEGRFWWCKKQIELQNLTNYSSPLLSARVVVPADAQPSRSRRPTLWQPPPSRGCFWSEQEAGLQHNQKWKSTGGCQGDCQRRKSFALQGCDCASNVHCGCLQQKDGPFIKRECNETHFNTRVTLFFYAFKQVQKTGSTNWSLKSS